MTVFDGLLAFVGLSVLLLLAGNLLRRCRWLRRLGVPEALLAGLLGLVVGPHGPLPLFPSQVYAVWEQTPAALISVVFATVFLGTPLQGPGLLWRRAASQVSFGMVLGFGQYLVGGLLVLLVLHPRMGVHPLAASLIEVAFEGGPGTAAGMGRTFTALGFPEGRTLGVALASLGILSATLIGTGLVVIARSRHWLRAGASRHPPPRPLAPPPTPATPVESFDPDPPTIDRLTLNLALVGTAVGVGMLLRNGLIGLGGRLGGAGGGRLMEAIPLFPLAMVGGLLVQFLLQHQKWENGASAPLQRSLGSLAMDLLIVAALASLDLPLLREALGPVLLLAVAGLAWNVAMLVLLAPRLFPDHWFERGIADFGQATGVAANGLLLLRMADPGGRTPVFEAFSLKQLAFEPFLGGGLVTALAPIAITGWGLGRWTGICLALTLAGLLLGLSLSERNQGRQPR
ncbi:MAG: sodium:solute symporter [Synechococcaceae cyanobacterium]|nr:sodium:solute symporter [Synechococcaceae cyanobacterium]